MIDWFIIEEKKIKGIFLRGKNKSQLEIKNEILILNKKIVNNFFIFIGISYVITIFSFIYISCFINVYYYSGFEWIKSGVFYFILSQIISIFFFLLETSIRFVAIRFKSEKIFKFSKFVGY